MKDDLNTWDWSALFSCSNPTLLIQVLLDFLDLLASPAIDNDHIKPTGTTGSLLTNSEREIVGLLGKIIKLVSEKPENLKNYDTCLYRFAISLLGVKDVEARCFLNRSLIDWNFVNAADIELVKEMLEKELHLEISNTPKRSLEPPTGRETPETLSPKPRKMGGSTFALEKYQELTQSIAKLPEAEQAEYAKKLEELTRNIESSAMKNSSTGYLEVGQNKDANKHHIVSDKKITRNTELPKESYDINSMYLLSYFLNFIEKKPSPKKKN